MKNVLTILGAGLAALGVSACCWIPALLGVGAAGSLGIGAALAPYRPYLLVVTGLFLVAGFTFVYRRPAGACCTEDGCLTEGAAIKRKVNIGVMWAVALFAIAMAAYPYIGAAQLAQANSQSAVKQDSAALKPIVFNVEGMDCAACAVPIKEKVENLPGVYSATIDYDAKTLVVQTADKAPTNGEIIGAVKEAGFTAHKK